MTRINLKKTDIAKLHFFLQGEWLEHALADLKLGLSRQISMSTVGRDFPSAKKKQQQQQKRNVQSGIT